MRSERSRRRRRAVDGIALGEMRGTRWVIANQQNETPRWSEMRDAGHGRVEPGRGACWNVESQQVLARRERYGWWTGRPLVEGKPMNA